MSKAIEGTRDLAYAAGRDAGNKSMRKAGRIQWNDEDWQAACTVFNKVFPTSPAASEAVKGQS